MPDIPFLPGVPPLLSYAANSVVLLAEDVIGAIFGLPFLQWGIFLDGLPVLPTNSMVTFEHRQDWIISEYQVEQGSFESYDKVQMPFDVRMRVTSGPTAFDRQALLSAIIPIANSLALLDVITPEQVYSGCTISHYDYRRSAVNGVGMIVMDVWLTEVREVNAEFFGAAAGQSGTQNTISPANAGTVGGGNVQAATPNSSVQSGFDDLGGAN